MMRVEPEFVYSYGDSEEQLSNTLRTMIAARDIGLKGAEDDLAKFEEFPSSVMWEEIKKKHTKCTYLDLEFMELFDCLKEKIIRNHVYRLESSKDQVKIDRKKFLKSMMDSMYQDKLEYVARLSLAREKFDKKMIEVLANKNTNKEEKKNKNL